MCTAWADESGITHEGQDFYVLGAAVVAPQDQDEIRASMRALRLPGERKAHWYSRSHRNRLHLVQYLSGSHWWGLITVRRAPPGESQERQRRKCLELFACDLESAGVGSLSMESRGARADARDRALIDALRARRMVQSLRVDHVPGFTEPLVWLADALCGAQSAAIRGDDTALALLSDRLAAPRTAQTPGPTIRRELPGFTS